MAEKPMKIIAHIKSDFPDKFGIPRQSGLVEGITAQIIFEKEFRSPDAIRGLDGFSHLWLIWKFSHSAQSDSLTVRPPRLGGNTRLGVFATRSPFRPNPIGLSCVKILRIEKTKSLGSIIHVSGADLMDGTPIYDIKPYLPHVDSIKNSFGGFAQEVEGYCLKVNLPEKLCKGLDEKFKATLKEILSNDPRPSYQNDAQRVYGFKYSGYEIHFRVEDEILNVVNIEKIGRSSN